jgi:hypothetical protein
MRPRRRLAEFPLVWYYASTWIGIDGDGSPDVLQVGCDSDVLSFLGHHNAAIESVAGVVPRWIVLDQQFSGKPGRYDGLRDLRRSGFDNGGGDLHAEHDEWGARLVCRDSTEGKRRWWETLRNGSWKR